NAETISLTSTSGNIGTITTPIVTDAIDSPVITASASGGNVFLRNHGDNTVTSSGQANATNGTFSFLNDGGDPASCCSSAGIIVGGSISANSVTLSTRAAGLNNNGDISLGSQLVTGTNSLTL